MNSSSEAWLSLAGVIGAFAINVAWQLAHCRLVRGRNLLGTVAAGFVVGLVLVVLFAMRRNGQAIDMSFRWREFLLVDLPLYVCLAYGYANVVQLSQCSVRTRIYEEVCRYANGLPLWRLREIYNEANMIQTRLRRLMESGDLKLQDGIYRAGRRRLVWVANLVFATKRFVLGKDSEFQLGTETLESTQ